MNEFYSEKVKLGSEKFNIVKAQESVLQKFSLEQQIEIKKRLNILSSIVYFIGKDFEITIELNDPGKGWHWDFKNNIVRVDPKDLLETPIEYSCFVMGHEAGHRRISRTHFIPNEVWSQTGFPFLMNAIEDPRENNFVADNYPAFAERMELAYKADLDLEEKSIEKAKERLGKIPRFMQAGFEYIRLWFLERLGQDVVIKEDLPQEVKEVVEKTLGDARESWWTYPSRKEADSSEQIISDYAEASYQINLEKIWPEFKKLVDEDVKDEATRQLAEDMKKEKGERGESEPYEPTAEEIQKVLDEMTEEQKQELQEKSRQIIDALAKEIAKELQGQLSENPEEKETRENQGQKSEEGEDKKQSVKTTKKSQKEEKGAEVETQNREAELKKQKDLENTRRRLKEISQQNQNRYEQERANVSEIINKLRNELYSIFSERKKTKIQKGFKSGRTINLGKRIGEIAKGLLPIESKAWEKKEKPTEKDYAFSILVDLSGSMQGERIQETFKAIIVLSEVLNSLGIKFEVLGFNNQIYEFLKFDQKLSDEVRAEMQKMLSEVNSSRARWNDDGWAVEKSSERLDVRKEEEKFLLVLSDGEPAPSAVHSDSKYDLDKVVKKITKTAGHELIGLGIGSGTEHVAKYYSQNIANISINQLPEKLAELLRNIIERD